MEHAQRGLGQGRVAPLNGVLILILMEHAQRESLDMVEDQRFIVLILILMEHAQRDLPF